MALKSMTKLLVGLFFILGASTAISSDATCKNGQGGDCEDGTPKQDVSVLFQSKNAQVLTALVSSTDDSNMAWQASMRPRLQKMMEIGATFQDIKDLIGDGTTPEVAGIIAGLIKIIEDDLQEKVKRDQTSAQTELDTRIDALTTTTKTAVELKASVDQLDKSHDQCVTEEHQMLGAYETCKDEEAVLMEEKPSAAFCGSPDFDISYPDSPQLDATLVVDFSKGLDFVKEQLDLYLQPLHDYIARIKVQAASDQAKWDFADETCNAKTKELQEKTVECGQKLDAWRAQHEKCLNEKNGQELSLCAFGNAYQSKCAAKTAFDTLKADITGKGTSYSELDRKKEWRQTTRLACVLKEFKSTTELTTGAVEACTKSNDDAAKEFESDVGSINLQEATYDNLTSETSFTCAEAAMKFGTGVLWTVPENSAGEVPWIPKSTDYTKSTDYKYAIDPDSSNKPFGLC